MKLSRTINGCLRLLDDELVVVEHRGRSEFEFTVLCLQRRIPPTPKIQITGQPARIQLIRLFDSWLLLNEFGRYELSLCFL